MVLKIYSAGVSSSSVKHHHHLAQWLTVNRYAAVAADISLRCTFNGLLVWNCQNNQNITHDQHVNNKHSIRKKNDNCVFPTANL